MLVFNGQTTYDNHSPIQHGNIDQDVCLERVGGAWENFVYIAKCSCFINDNEFSIPHYELINVLVALRVWTWQHKRVVFKVDNLAIVTIYNCGYTRCRHLTTMVRNIWLETAKYDLEMVKHIPGKVNRMADLLSSFYNSHTNNVELQSMKDQPMGVILMIIYFTLIITFNLIFYVIFFHTLLLQIQINSK